MPIQPKQQPPYYKEGLNTKIYTAFLRQTGTNPPVPIILQNTLGNIVWTRQEPGGYQGTLLNAFPEGKRFVTCNTDAEIGNVLTKAGFATDEEGYIQIWNYNDTTTADEMDAYIEIKIYN